MGKGGAATLYVNGNEVAQGRIEQTVPFVFSMSGESFDVGIDFGAPVGPYEPEFPFTGAIKKIQIDLTSELAEADRQAMLYGQFQAALASQ